MTKELVYLAGGITGMPNSEISDWRKYAKDKFAPEIDVISPLRQKFETIDESQELGPEDRLALMKHGRSTATRDRFDVMRSSAVLVNLVGSTRVSIGSVGEIFWADAFRKPIVVVREPNNIHTHAMLDALIGWIFVDIDEAIHCVRTLLM